VYTHQRSQILLIFVEICLFCRDIRLFCGDTELFRVNTRLFCVYTPAQPDPPYFWHLCMPRTARYLLPRVCRFHPQGPNFSKVSSTVNFSSQFSIELTFEKFSTNCTKSLAKRLLFSSSRLPFLTSQLYSHFLQ